MKVILLILVIFAFSSQAIQVDNDANQLDSTVIETVFHALVSSQRGMLAGFHAAFHFNETWILDAACLDAEFEKGILNIIPETIKAFKEGEGLIPAMSKGIYMLIFEYSEFHRECNINHFIHTLDKNCASYGCGPVVVFNRVIENYYVLLKYFAGALIHVLYPIKENTFETGKYLGKIIMIMTGIIN